MLIEFSVTNFLSLRERQTFSLVADQGGELLDSNSFASDATGKLRLLRSAAIYGPNASGKTNLLLAMLTMRLIVRESSAHMKPDGRLPVRPFLLSQDASESPSEFEVMMIIKGVRYLYGFSACAQRIRKEWLRAYPQDRPQNWFVRTWDEQLRKYSWEFSSKFMGQKALWQRTTRDNALFLSTAVQFNSEQLQPVYDWFDKTLRVMNVAGNWSPRYSAFLYREHGKEAQIINYLRAADTNIKNVVIKESPFDSSELPEDMPDHIKRVVSQDMENKTMLEIKTEHEVQGGKTVALDFEFESRGTQKFFSLTGPWIDVLEHGRILVIDELHNSLHPKLVEFLVSIFHSSDTNPKNAQLVFTTHETSILWQDILRRDQIWFCDKDRGQATKLYPLTDFKPRKGYENLEAAYLSGRYGALPHLMPVRGAD